MIVLDQYQQAGADWREGHAIVAAAAGSGKSSMIIERIAALIVEGVPASKILTLVYNKAAEEQFSARLSIRLKENGKKATSLPPVKTYHAFALSLLNEWLSGDAEWKRMKLLLNGADFRFGLDAMKVSGIEAPDVKPYLTASAAIREALIDTSDKRLAADQASKLAIFGGDRQAAMRGIAFTVAFQTIKMNANVYDFTDMLSGAILLADASDQLTHSLSVKYDHVQCDELQDITRARWQLVQLVAKDAVSFVGVGDLRQDIYSFVATESKIILDYYKSGEAKLLTLPINRRSTKTIVEFGNKICRGYDWHLGNDALPKEDADEGEEIEVWQTTQGDEGERVAEYVKEYLSQLPSKDAKAPARVGILSRTNAGLVGVETALRQIGVPLRVSKAPGGVWASYVGLDFISYLRAAEGELFDGLTKISNKPVRYVKNNDVYEAINTAKKQRLSLFDALKQVRSRGAKTFSEDLALLHALPWDRRCDAIAAFFAQDARNKASADIAVAPDEDKAEVYRRLSDAAKKFGSLLALNASVEEAGKNEKSADVELLTCHASKGLEFDLVIGVGIAKGHMPHIKSSNYEEERRVFYVLATRAKHHLILSAGGEASSFLVEFGMAKKSSGKVEAYVDEEDYSDKKSMAKPIGVFIRKKPVVLQAPSLKPAAYDRTLDCSACRGEGEITMLGKTITCTQCRGTGEWRSKR